MELKEFQKDFFEDIKASAATSGEGSVVEFVNIFSEYLINAEVIPDFTSSFFSGSLGSKRLRVDGYVFDEFDFTMTLIVADYSGELIRDTLTQSVAKVHFDRLMNFLEGSFSDKLIKNIEVSTPAADLVDLLRFYKVKIRKYRLILLTDGIMSGRITTLPNRVIEDIPVECQIWDMDRLFRVCISFMGRQDVEIDFKAYTKFGIPCLEASSTTTEEYKSFLCIIPGEVIADIYDTYGSQLLEGNVRSFLSTKVSVNKKIRETIISKPEKFFAYNNGVSAAAMSLKIENTADGKYITYAKDFQIINGGQTTASLSNARHKDKADLSKVFVQMKLTEVDSDPDKSSELVRNISRSSNSQNKVSDADFFATHPFHVRIENISRRIYAPAVGGAQYETKWFYERARGQYLQMQMRLTKSEKAKFIAQQPKSQVITKTDIAKVRNTWGEQPHIVSRGAQTNFMKFAEIIDEAWTNSDLEFNEKYFKDTVALTILFKHTEYIVTRQQWYEQGYRANIVTYSLSMLHKLIKQQFPGLDLDLQLIWNRQSVPDVITEELIKITKFCFETITSSNRETINVTQWCKREACWNKMKGHSHVLNNQLEKLLVSKTEAKAIARDAKKDQRIASDVEAQTKVLEYGADFWKNVKTFSEVKRIGSQDTLMALKYAIQIPVKFPSAYQSVKLLEFLEQIQAEGFKI